MTKSQRMKPVLKIAQARKETAIRELGAAQRHLREQETRLNELHEYRKEYLQQTDVAGGKGINAVRYVHIQHFLNNLNAAIEQQRQVVEYAVHICEEKKRFWQEARTKSESLDRVVRHYVRQELHEESRREQKETDEVAQQKGRRKLDDRDGRDS